MTGPYADRSANLDHIRQHTDQESLAELDCLAPGRSDQEIKELSQDINMANQTSGKALRVKEALARWRMDDDDLNLDDEGDGSDTTFLDDFYSDADCDDCDEDEIITDVDGDNRRHDSVVEDEQPFDEPGEDDDFLYEEEDWLDESDYERYSEDDDDDGYFWGDDDDPVGDNTPDTDDYEY